MDLNLNSSHFPSEVNSNLSQPFEREGLISHMGESSGMVPPDYNGNMNSSGHYEYDYPYPDGPISIMWDPGSDDYPIYGFTGPDGSGDPSSKSYIIGDVQQYYEPNHFDIIPIGNNTFSANQSGHQSVKMMNMLHDAGASSIDLFILECLLIGMVCCVGFIGNALILAVLIKDGRKVMINVLLGCLAVADFLMLSYIFPFHAVKRFCGYYNHCSCTLQLHKMIFYAWPWFTLVQTWMTWIIVLTTALRFLVVRFPFKAKHWTNWSNGLRILTIVSTCCLLFSLPRIVVQYFFNESDNITGKEIFVSGVYPNGQNSSSQHCANDPNYYFQLHQLTTRINFIKSNYWYKIIYHVGMIWVVVYIIPLLLLVVLNIKLILELRSAVKGHAFLTRNKDEKETISITVNVVAVVTIFLICQTPDFVAVILTYDTVNVSRNFLKYYLPICVLLQAFNSAVNFAIYCMYYKRFRKTARNLFKISFGKSKSANTSTSDSNTNQTNSALLTKDTPCSDTNKNKINGSLHNDPDEIQKLDPEKNH